MITFVLFGGPHLKTILISLHKDTALLPNQGSKFQDPKDGFIPVELVGQYFQSFRS